VAKFIETVNIREVNTGYSVKLALKKNASGTCTVYYSVWNHLTKQRSKHYEQPPLVLASRDDTYRQDKLKFEHALKKRNAFDTLFLANPLAFSFDGIDASKNLIAFGEKHAKNASKWQVVAVNLRSFLKIGAGKDVSFSALSRSFFRGFVEHLETTGIHANSINEYLRRIHAVLTIAKKEKIISQEVLELVNEFRVKKIETEPIHFTKEEIEKLENHVAKNPKQEEIRLALLFSCFTGLRRSDVSSITWQEVESNELKKLTKKAKTRIAFPLSRKAIAILDQTTTERMPENKIFDLPENEATTGIHAKRLIEKLGLNPQASFHSARHTFAINALEAGVGIFTLKEMLGHKDIASTMKYARITSKTASQAIEKIDKYLG